jgi:hypothetical protein
VLVDKLPPDSVTKTEIRDGMTVEEWEALPQAASWGQWSHLEQLVATVADRVSWLDWTLRAVNAAKPGDVPPAPEPIPRPGVGRGPLGAVAAKERRDHLGRVARLKAIQALGGGEPTPDQVRSVLDELTAGGGPGDE